jgi:hypothetical protein
MRCSFKFEVEFVVLVSLVILMEIDLIFKELKHDRQVETSQRRQFYELCSKTYVSP